MFEDGIRELQESVRLSGRLPLQLSYLCMAYAFAGQRVEALKLLDELKEQEKKRYVRPWCYVLAYMGLGDHERALEYLRKSYENRDISIMLRTASPLDPLRSDPHFQALLDKMKFPK